MGYVGNGLLAALCFSVALWLIFRKKSKKVATFLMFVAGMFLGGLIGALIADALATLGKTTGPVLAKFAGLTISGVLFILCVLACLELWHGMHPKKGKAGKHHPWLALAAPTLFLAGGGVFAAIVRGIAGATSSVGNTLTTMLGG
jgi:hypothetical protein